MPEFSSFLFSSVFVLQFVFILVWFVASLVVVTAIWRAMKAHESLARSMRVIAQEMTRNKTAGAPEEKR